MNLVPRLSCPRLEVFVKSSWPSIEFRDVDCVPVQSIKLSLAKEGFKRGNAPELLVRIGRN